MAKKKKQKSSKFSPKSYLKSGKARDLPIYECLISDNWKELGKANALISRQHKSGNFTVGLFLVDLLCTGVKDTGYYVNVPKDYYHEMVQKYQSNREFDMIPMDYNTFHNIIYGAIEFAEEYGIPPHQDFALTKMVLAEDNDDIPLIDIEFGQDGLPHLFPAPGEPKTKFYHDQLKKHAGEGNFYFTMEKDDFDNVENYENDVQDDDCEEDDIEMPDLWEYDEWLYFIDTIQPFELAAHQDAARIIFERCLYLPAMEGKTLYAPDNLETPGINITFEPLSQHSYTQEEVKEQEAINRQLQKAGDAKDSLEKITTRINKAIEKWPENPIFYNCLYNAYRLQGNYEAANKTAAYIYHNFPDYVIGTLTYLLILVFEDRPEGVQKILNGRYDIKALFPHRHEFHITELYTFLMLMCYFFLKKEEFFHAYSYWRLLDELEIGPFEKWHHNVIDIMEKSILKEVGGLLFDIRNNPEKKEKIIKTLTQPLGSEF